LIRVTHKIKKFKIKTIATIIFTLLADTFLASNALGIDLKKFTKRYLVNDPSPTIIAKSLDQTAKWYDDYPYAKSQREWELEFDINSQYDLKLRQAAIAGVHYGETTKYTCIAGLCSNIGAGLVSGNTATDTITYNLETLQLIVLKENKFFGQNFFKPTVGLNVLDITLRYSGAGEPKSENIVMPIPMVGVYSELPFKGGTKLYFESNFFEFQKDKTSYKHYETSFGITRKISDALEFTIGLKNLIYRISNNGNSANIQLDIKQNTPFLGINLIFNP